MLATLLAMSQLLNPAAADPEPAEQHSWERARPEIETSISKENRTALLGKSWSSSHDRAVTTSGDATALHILAAEPGDGYAWRTVASLSEPGIETDQWIGNVCVTGSGKRAVVAYAPRHFANRSYLAARGAFTAVVDMDSGAVRKLPITTSLSYFNPGCGSDETAVLTQGGGEDLPRTRLTPVNAKTGKLGRSIVASGQVTSALPTRLGVVAAAGTAVVQVSAGGKLTTLARTAGTPYRMAVDGDGGVVYLERGDDETAHAKRLSLSGGHRVHHLASGSLTELGVATGRSGQVFLSGRGIRAETALPASVQIAKAGRDDDLSSRGQIAVSRVVPSAQRNKALVPLSAADELAVDITATSLVTGKEFTLTTIPTPVAGPGAKRSPALAEVAVAGDPNDPTDDTLRTCSIPRNDPRNQPMQPKPRQVEWAVNQLVTGSLDVTRETNWKNLGMSAYNVTEMFSNRPLLDGGRVPAQILLGIALAESNLAQSAWYAVPGVSANPLISNYYGVADRSGDVSGWQIDFSQADCGYGVMQITDGMRRAGSEKPGETALPVEKQRAVALDFVANIAEGERILASKWNATRSEGLTLNNGQPGYLENWFYALWAYNSGYYPRSERDENLDAWGVGWFNNPINPRYDQGREPFMSVPDHGRTPQKWPYPEKVLGYAGNPVDLIESPGVMVPAYRPAGWLNEAEKQRVKPPVDLFCQPLVNSCNADNLDTGLDPCTRPDYKCWFNQPATWKRDCESHCGQQFIRFDPGYPYQADGTAYLPNCSTSGLPSNALIIDNLPTSAPSIRPNCSKSFTNSGSFSLNFASDGNSTYRSKIDLHQLGTGFGGQFWMGNSYRATNMKVTGTWTFNQNVGAWARVLIHLPVVGARTQQARYEIDVNGDGSFTKFRYINQEIQRNGWVSLGVYNFQGVPRVRLTNMTEDGRGTERVAWDAVAVQPLPGKPKHIVAGLGDSYSSGEGSRPYFAESDANHGTHRWNACRRSKHSWVRQVVLPGSSGNLGNNVDAFDPNHELGFVACSGADTTNVRGRDAEGLPWQPESWNYPEQYDDGEGQFHEVAQIESGVLDENTTLVVFTLGGNDEGGFTNALKDCGFDDCAADAEFLPRNKAIIDRTKNRLKQTIREIHAQAPNAQIVLLAYPEMFSRYAECSSMSFEGWLFDLDEAKVLAELVDYLDMREEELQYELGLEGLPVYQTDPIGEFVGHGICDGSPWINPLMVGPNGDGDFHSGDKPSEACLPESLGGKCLSRESFHPNNYGTVGYAQVLGDYLYEIGYVGG